MITYQGREFINQKHLDMYKKLNALPKEDKLFVLKELSDKLIDLTDKLKDLK